MDHRYHGRHLPPAPHTVVETTGDPRRKRRRGKRKRNLLPAAAALTILGALIGGVGAVVHFDGQRVTNEAVGEYNPADYAPPADRDAAVDRGSRDERVPGAEAKTAPEGPCAAAAYSTSKKTASGEKFDPEALTAAHPSLPFGTRVRVTNADTGDQVVVRINDRGGAPGCLGLSRAAFRTVAAVGAGSVEVTYETLG